MARKTFEHLEDQRRRPDVYEEVTAYVQWGETFRGKFPNLPNEGANYHYPEHYKLGYWDPTKTRWKSHKWESYRDPNRLTYRSYHEIQSEREAALETVITAARAERAVRYLDPEWVETLRMFFAPMRFAEWGISMAHQYVSRFSISSLITNPSVLQVFDELRHTQRIAEWTNDLEAEHGGFGGYRTQWLQDPMFQPMREYLERVCVLRDWGEVVVSTNLVFEPLLQRVMYRTLSDLGNAHSDSVLPHFAYSLYGDEQRHWSWAAALAAMLNEESDENVATTVEWVESWTPLALRSVEALAPAFSGVGNDHVFDLAIAEARTLAAEVLDSAGMSGTALQHRTAASGAETQ
jgi:toluene monooxygenase system protein E